MWVFLGAQIDVSRDGGPSLSAPSTHTRIFLRRAAVELEAKDTLCKPEFHSLLAKSGFLPGEGVRTPVCECVCVYARMHMHTAMGTSRGRHMGGGCLLRRAGDPCVSQHSDSMALGKPVSRSSDKYLE